MIVVLAAWFPQDRIGFLGLLAYGAPPALFWPRCCTTLRPTRRRSRLYRGDRRSRTRIGATGGVSPDVFMLAVFRASEICIGIVCAGSFSPGPISAARNGDWQHHSPIWRLPSPAGLPARWTWRSERPETQTMRRELGSAVSSRSNQQ